MNKKILTIGSSGITAVLLVLAVTSYGSSIQTQEFVLSEPIMPEAELSTLTETPLSVPPRPIMKLITHPIEELEMAKTMLGFDIKYPILPKGYNVQAMSADPESGTYKMLLANNEVTSTTTFEEFYADGGILIFIEDHSDGNIDTENWSTNWLERDDGLSVSINDKNGIIKDIKRTSFVDGSLLTDPAKVVFYEGKVLHKVQGISNTNDLVKLAESLD